MPETDRILSPADTVLVTGANGFIGARVVGALLSYGFTRIRAFVRPSGSLGRLKEAAGAAYGDRVEPVVGNLLSRDDCRRAVRGAAAVLHLAAGIEKTFPGCFMNSVVTTRNLLDAALEEGGLRRFVNVSSFSVYSNLRLGRGRALTENCPVEDRHMERYEPYAYGKARQDDLVREYGRERGLPYVIVRPGVVFGPGNGSLSARVGVDTFGFFLHLGGGNRIPFTYVDNCAEAVVLAGIRKGVEGEVLNVVDDELPTSREFLRMYKRRVGPFRTLYVPYRLFYAFCAAWEKYSAWSEGQLPPVFNRRRCAAYWQGNRFPNARIKEKLGWTPRVPMGEAIDRYLEALEPPGR
jgi:nucleoside-diphosphate-sugar epimerase